MSIEGRLDKLEGGRGGVCTCERAFDVVWPEEEREASGDDRRSEICPRCGGERITFVVVYDEEEAIDAVR